MELALCVMVLIELVKSLIIYHYLSSGVGLILIPASI